MYDAPKGDGTVAKALTVLDQVAAFDRPVRFSELLAESPYPKPTLYRFVQTLTNQGMLHFDPDRQTYSLGLRLVRLAHSAWRQSTLADVARPFIEDLAQRVGEAVHLAQADDGHVLFVDKRKVTDNFETFAQAGRVAPAYCTGVGKAILAYLPDYILDRTLCKQSFFGNTPSTLTTRDTLVAQLAEIRADGVAFDREEHERGIISIAAPILNSKQHAIGAISIATSVARQSLESLSAFKPDLLATAQDISNEAEAWQFPTRQI